MSDIDQAFAVNPGPARAIGMPWYVGQNSWRDATATNFGLRYGWREMFGGAYADVMYCTPSCTALPYPGKVAATELELFGAKARAAMYTGEGQALESVQ